LQELGLPELTTEQVAQLCTLAEAAARRYVLSKVPSRRIETLNISIEAEGTKPLRMAIDVEVALSPEIRDFDSKELSDEAVKEAFASAEKYLRKLACHSQK
jgi:hypothetical protein